MSLIDVEQGPAEWIRFKSHIPSQTWAACCMDISLINSKAETAPLLCVWLEM